MYNINVTADAIVNDELISLTKGTYGVELAFNFIGDKWDGLIKKAVFDGKETLIINNSCIIPAEVAETTGNKRLGVYGYELESDELKLRVSPYPSFFCVIDGSFDKSLSEAGATTPTDFERQVAEIESVKSEAIGLLEVRKDEYAASLGEVVDVATLEINNDITTAKAEIQNIVNQAYSELETLIDDSGVLE